MSCPPAQTAEEFDLDYAIEEDMPPGRPTRDTQFIIYRLPRLVAEIGARRPHERVLDVGCGFGQQVSQLLARGDEAWGLDASFDLAYYTNHYATHGRAPGVCATAESLPFRDSSFDRVVCQGSLDHFAQPRSFLREVARVLKPDGRAVIAISNYDSLSCRLGRGLYAMKMQRGVQVYHGRNYWEIPRNHTFRGTYSVLRRIGGPHLELLDCRGISMFWLFHRWTRLVEALPRPLAVGLLAAADRVAYRLPAFADIAVSVWRPRKAHNGR